MDLLRLLLTILVGAGSGVIGGALGVNGSFIMLPAVLFLHIVNDYSMAVGTILLSVLPPLSILAVIDYYKRKKVDVTVAILLSLSYFIAAKYGSKLHNEYSNKTLKYCTTAVFFLCGLYFWWSAHNDKA